MLERQPFEQRRLSNFGHELERSYDFLPYSDLARWLPWDSFYEVAQNKLPLGRLGGIRTLSFLSYIGTDNDSVQFLEYTHTRLDHSLTVAMVIETILKRNGFPQDDINLGIVSGLIHDIGMPAYGDATKKIDPEALDEEKHWWKALGKDGQRFITELGMSRKKMESIVCNKGVLGQVLDIADRITYTMKDLYLTAGEKKEILNPSLSPRLLPIRLLLSYNPDVGNIYKDVGVDRKTGMVFFNDPENLNIFLLLRAHMYQMLYLNPINQGRDLFVKHLIEPLYSRNGKRELTPDKLREMTDSELLMLMQKHYQKSAQIPNSLYNDLTNWRPEFKKFDSLEEATKFENEIKELENIIAIDKAYECKGFDPGTSYNVVVNKKGDIEPFKDSHHGSREIERIADSTRGFYVFYADMSKNQQIENLLKAIFEGEKN